MSGRTTENVGELCVTDSHARKRRFISPPRVELVRDATVYSRPGQPPLPRSPYTEYLRAAAHYLKPVATTPYAARSILTSRKPASSSRCFTPLNSFPLAWLGLGLGLGLGLELGWG